MRRAPWEVVVAAAAIAITLIHPTPTRADVDYLNPEFGLYVPIPEGLQMCEHPDLDFQEFVEHNHGTSIFLDPTDSQSCSTVDIENTVDIEHGRAIFVSAWYNATDYTRTLKLFRRNECEAKRCLPAPKGLGFPNSRSASYRVNGRDGWIDIVVLTQAGHNDFAFPGDPEFWVNYIAELHTDRAHLTDDLRIFRQLLGTIRFIRLEPNKDSFSPEELGRICKENARWRKFPFCS
jgi:hypothetical protein